MLMGKAKIEAPPDSEHDDEAEVEHDDELKELILLEKKRKIYNWKLNNQEYKERLAAIKHKFRPPIRPQAMALDSMRPKQVKMLWGRDHKLYEVSIPKNHDFQKARDNGALEKISTEGEWKPDSLSRGTSQWRRYQMIQDGAIIKYARFVKMDDGSLLVQEGVPKSEDQMLVHAEEIKVRAC